MKIVIAHKPRRFNINLAFELTAIEYIFGNIRVAFHHFPSADIQN